MGHRDRGLDLDLDIRPWAASSRAATIGAVQIDYRGRRRLLCPRGRVSCQRRTPPCQHRTSSCRQQSLCFPYEEIGEASHGCRAFPFGVRGVQMRRGELCSRSDAPANQSPEVTGKSQMRAGAARHRPARVGRRRRRARRGASRRGGGLDRPRASASGRWSR